MHPARFGRGHRRRQDGVDLPGTVRPAFRPHGPPEGPQRKHLLEVAVQDSDRRDWKGWLAKCLNETMILDSFFGFWVQMFLVWWTYCSNSSWSNFLISCKQWKIFNALVLALGSFIPLFSQDHVSTLIHNKSSLLQIDSDLSSWSTRIVGLKKFLDEAQSYPNGVLTLLLLRYSANLWRIKSNSSLFDLKSW